MIFAIEPFHFNQLKAGATVSEMITTVEGQHEKPTEFIIWYMQGLSYR